jgi:hypothetical protein
MAGINDYSNTAGSNTTINGIDIAEGCSPAGINNAIRQLMADIADIDDGVVPLQTPDINGGTIDGAIIGGTTPAAGTFTNLTATGTLTGLLGNVVEDGTPQLGGNLDTNGNDINFGDNDKAQFGASNDLEIFHDGSNSYIIEQGTGNLRLKAENLLLTTPIDENYLVGTANGDVKLYYNGVQKIATTTGGISVTGAVVSDGLDMSDNDKILLGDSDDLQIYHDGSNSYIDDNGTGDFIIRARDIAIKSITNENHIVCIENGSTSLYYDNSKKFETTSGGATVTGTLTATAFSGDGSSLTGITGGTAWQTVKTASFTAVASEGYFVNTTSGAITATLPASPTQGDEVSFIDYAGTFDTNNLTIGRNGKPIQGDASNLTVATERAGLTLVFVDNTQGWLLKEK